MMKKVGHGVKFCSFISIEQDCLVGFAFVDDMDTVEGDLHTGNFMMDNVFEFMQDCIDRWERGIKATGGAIRPYKMFVYPLSFY